MALAAKNRLVNIARNAYRLGGALMKRRRSEFPVSSGAAAIKLIYRRDRGSVFGFRAESSGLGRSSVDNKERTGRVNAIRRHAV